MKNAVRRILFLIAFLSAHAAGAECESAYQIYKTVTHPFMVKHCAECHGNEDIAGALEAPLHSVIDPLKAYPAAKQYLNLDQQDWMKSRLIIRAENGHCHDYKGKSDCGAVKGEFTPVVEQWIKAEMVCNSMAPAVENAQGISGNNANSPEVNSQRNHILEMRRQAYSVRQNAALAQRDEILKVVGPPIKKLYLNAQITMCALFEGGRAACWGNNQSRNLGYPAADADKYDSYRGYQVDYQHPNTVSTPYIDLKEDIVDLALGESFTCALLKSGKAKCWGANASGQLGTDSDLSLVPIQSAQYVKISEPIEKIYAQGESACAVLASGHAKCWGKLSDYSGGVTRYYESLTRTVGKTKSPIGKEPEIRFSEKITALTISPFQTCALLSSGKIKCWGMNFDGGLGANLDRVLVTPSTGDAILNVPLDEPVTQIVSSGYSVCALLQSGKAKCWGGNGVGQLGVDSTLSAGTRDNHIEKSSNVLLDEKIVALYALGSSMCASFENQNIKCWGGTRPFYEQSNANVGKVPGSMKSIMPIYLGMDTIAPLNDFSSDALVSKFDLFASAGEYACVKLNGENAIRCSNPRYIGVNNGLDGKLKFPPVVVVPK
jgi:alpha-tubulin suppressor-like RCC1 family protein